MKFQLLSLLLALLCISYVFMLQCHVCSGPDDLDCKNLVSCPPGTLYCKTIVLNENMTRSCAAVCEENDFTTCCAEDGCA